MNMNVATMNSASARFWNYPGFVYISVPSAMLM